MAAIEDGLYQLSMKQRLAELEREKTALTSHLTARPQSPAVHVHPNLKEAYRRCVSELARQLDDPELRDDAIEATRSMLELLVVGPRDGVGGGLSASRRVGHGPHLGRATRAWRDAFSTKTPPL